MPHQAILPVACGPRRSGRSTLLRGLGYRDILIDGDKNDKVGIETCCGRELEEVEIAALEAATRIDIHLVPRDYPGFATGHECAMAFFSKLPLHQRMKVHFVRSPDMTAFL
jgi:hypothetical protein